MGAPDDDAIFDDERRDGLVAAALQARQRAHVPYSDFAMGAAVATASGETIVGTLVENVSLGLAMCAERGALFATIAQGEQPVAVALASGRTDGELTLPCGACLQVALELGGPDLVVIATAPDGETRTTSVAELLPHGPRKRAAS